MYLQAARLAESLRIMCMLSSLAFTWQQSLTLSDSQDAEEECEVALGRSEEDVGQLKVVWEKTEEVLGPVHSARFKVRCDYGRWLLVRT